MGIHNVCGSIGVELMVVLSVWQALWMRNQLVRLPSTFDGRRNCALPLMKS